MNQVIINKVQSSKKATPVVTKIITLMSANPAVFPQTIPQINKSAPKIISKFKLILNISLLVFISIY